MQAPDGILGALTGDNPGSATRVSQIGVGKALAAFRLRRLSRSAPSVIVKHPGPGPFRPARALAIKLPNIAHVICEPETAKPVGRERSLEERRAFAQHPTCPGNRLPTTAGAAVRAFDGELTEGRAKNGKRASACAPRRVEEDGERL